MPFLALGVAVSAAIAAFVPAGAAAAGAAAPARRSRCPWRQSPAPRCPVASAARSRSPDASSPAACRRPQRSTFLLVGARDQPGRAGRDRGRVPGQARGRRGPCRREPARRDRRSAWSGRASARDDLLDARTTADIATRGRRLSVFAETAQHDLLQRGRLPDRRRGDRGDAADGRAAQRPRRASPAPACSRVLALAALAVVMAICSEADAFVAASLTQFSLTARLAFMVVGPMVDVKLIALQAGTFGGRFALRFAPLTLRRSQSAPRSSSAGGCCDRSGRDDQHARRRRAAAADVHRDVRALRRASGCGRG